MTGDLIGAAAMPAAPSPLAAGGWGGGTRRPAMNTWMPHDVRAAKNA